MELNENEKFRNIKKYYEELNRDFKYEEERRKKIIKDMKTNDDYINWLEKFTSKYPIFSNNFDDILEYNDLESDDIEKINKLGIFFDMVNAYAKENYIYPLAYEDENYYIKYFIKHNNVYYIIGYVDIYFTSYRLERVPNDRINEIDNYFEFRDIQNNRQQPNTDVIKIQLYSLANMMYEYSKRVPFIALEETVYNTLQDIEKNIPNLEERKVKKLGTK